ncbi:hypothetical protein DOTSEDRAFT_122318 [Dothistroma septosporum NZE10]|uniref:Transglycosylase SLT domain-containing protein n=1 Tax=Dothistroma septosporum (strain NZE10 / CBS 128990) TaxID=675120 RepID=N1Q2J9_DOTSN|nr:hypothetical protein DOTSEDRAFT_122318 [Dothistroma septosporum NZE10]
MGRGTGSLCKRIFALVFAAAIVAVIVAVCVVYIPRDHDESRWLKDQVTSTAAFNNGGGSHRPTVDEYGGGAGKDEYKLYTGKASTFPKKEDWVAFDDMWENNQKLIKTSCSDHGWGENNSNKENSIIKNEIQAVAKASLVDRRFILAIVLQESKACLRVKTTTSARFSIANPGLMQSHNGSSFDRKHSETSIRKMIQDGTQGTAHGDGLVQTLNQFGNAYAAARGYNSGAVAKSGDLDDAMGATTCYASDVANRLTGWVKAQMKCSEHSTTSGGGETSAGKESTRAAPVSTEEQGTPSRDTTAKHDTAARQVGGGTLASGDGAYHPDSNAPKRRRRRWSRGS